MSKTSDLLPGVSTELGAFLPLLLMLGLRHTVSHGTNWSANPGSHSRVRAAGSGDTVLRARRGR